MNTLIYPYFFKHKYISFKQYLIIIIIFYFKVFENNKLVMIINKTSLAKFQHSFRKFYDRVHSLSFASVCLEHVICQEIVTSPFVSISVSRTLTTSVHPRQPEFTDFATFQEIVIPSKILRFLLISPYIMVLTFRN